MIRFEDCPDDTVPFGAVATDPGSHWKVNIDQENYCTSIPAWATLTSLKSKQLPRPKRKVHAVYKDY
ncbi:MAG: hypothetical protein R3A45_01875 [Bdellovibrionota bacterium]